MKHWILIAGLLVPLLAAPTGRGGGGATGTCFVVHPDCLALTSAHLVDGADEINVRLASGKTVPASLEHISRSLDVAVLKLAASGVPYIELAERDNLRVGDPVFTLGFPVPELLGEEAKYAEGSVSSLSGIAGEASLMQISVPVQPGNSGGPLVNRRGEVVGIIAASASVRRFIEETGTLPQNVNWAVHSGYARELFDQPPALPRISSKADAISRARSATCFVSAFTTAGEGAAIPSSGAESVFQAWRDGNFDVCIRLADHYLGQPGAGDDALKIQFFKGRCYLQKGDYKMAVFELDKVLGKAPGSNYAAEALYFMAEALGKLGPRYRKAETKALQRLVQEHPNSPRVPLAESRLSVIQ